MATLFRDRAVAGRAAAEVTDRSLRIVSAPAWAALTLAIVLLGLLGVWLFAGSVAITTQGLGVIDNVPANTVVTASVDGRLVRPTPPIGSRVSAGDTIAVIAGDGESRERTIVTAPITGTVVAVGPGADSAVSADGALATIAPDTDEQVAYLFLPVAQVNRIRAGDPVNLQVETVDPTGDGLLQGTISEISPLPVDEARIAYLTANEGLTAEIAGSGPVIEVRVALTPDPQAPSGWRWTLPPGPSERVVSGTPARGSVILAEVRPYKAFLGTA